MAKDWSVRGNRVGNAAGADRKRKPLADRITEGKGNAPVLNLPEPTEFEGSDIPPLREYCVRRKSLVWVCAPKKYMTRHSVGYANTDVSGLLIPKR